MKLPDWLQAATSHMAKGLKLVPSDLDRIRSERDRYERMRREGYDQKTALEEEVRKLEARLLKLDTKRQAEHGVIARATQREMQLAAVQLKEKEKLLHEALDRIGEIDLMSGHLERLLTGRVIKAEEWDAIGLDREEQIAEESEANKARQQVERLGDRELREVGTSVDLEAMLGEIRGTPAPIDPATEEVVRKLKLKDRAEPEPEA